MVTYIIPKALLDDFRSFQLKDTGALPLEHGSPSLPDGNVQALSLYYFRMLAMVWWHGSCPQLH